MVQLLYLTFPPNKGSFLGLKTELHFRRLIQIPHTHPRKKPAQDIHFFTVEKELDFIQKVYKIQKEDNSLTVSQKINKFWGPGNFYIKHFLMVIAIRLSLNIR